MISRADCLKLDAEDPLAHARERFAMPHGQIYLDGNSLGCMPACVAERMQHAVASEWAQGLIRSWNEAGWYDAPRRTGAKIARLIGAEADEVIVTDSTSVNLFRLLAGVARLTPDRPNILCVEGDFPTDGYIAAGVGEMMQRVVRTVPLDVVLNSIDRSVGGVLLSHVNYKSGRVAEVDAITAAARQAGAFVIWDLSHTAGALEIDLNRAGIEFAVGCGYKYLNGGPGAPSYVFVARRMQSMLRQPLTGWFGHEDPFAFADQFVPAAGATRFLTGTPPVLSLLALESALEAFDDIDMRQLGHKSRALTSLFIDLAVQDIFQFGFELASPIDVEQRGAHVSLSHRSGYAIMQALISRGVIGDFRAPNLVRFGFAPLYTRYVDVFDAVEIVRQIMMTEAWKRPEFQTVKQVT